MVSLGHNRYSAIAEAVVSLNSLQITPWFTIKEVGMEFPAVAAANRDLKEEQMELCPACKNAI